MAPSDLLSSAPHISLSRTLAHQRTMKNTVFAAFAAALLVVFCQAQDDTRDNLVTADVLQEQDGANETVIKNDEWQAPGANWTPDAEDTREGGGNTNIPLVGGALVENKLEVFEGRPAALSLAAEEGHGGAARGNAHGDHEGEKTRNLLKTLRGNHE